MKKFLVFSLILLALTHSTAQAQHKVSDSLVKDLPCNNITSNEIYRRMSPQQFSSQYHIPIANWGVEVRGGLYELGVCWGLSRAQRLFFYLNRWNSDPSIKGPDTVQILNMLREEGTYAMMLNQESYPRTDYGVLGNLMDGAAFKSGSKNTHRNFRSEIERYEIERFHKIGKNLKLIIGSGDRSKNANRTTRDQLIRNLQINKLTLIIVRAKRRAQHVLLVKHYQKLDNGDIRFSVYDSNYPQQDNFFTYRQSDSSFYAPNIIYGVVPSKDINDAVGVYIVDEKERDPIESTLVRYYSSLCRSLKKP
ncbi:hypothetical protein [Bdellovibrio sp. HCB209]|uniref:hypothetical protein n=1 Tax=Bdellovibrio sp. HCB209 TaxID=3394354 RepID=UPI0039B48B89